MNGHQRDAAAQILVALTRIARDERAEVLEVVRRIVLDGLCILDPMIERDVTVRRDAHPVTDSELEVIHALREAQALEALRGPSEPYVHMTPRTQQEELAKSIEDVARSVPTYKWDK